MCCTSLFHGCMLTARSSTCCLVPSVLMLALDGAQQQVVQRVLDALDVHGLRLTAVDNSGDLPRVAQAAARTPSLHLARLRYHFDCHVASSLLAMPATRHRVRNLFHEQ